MSSDSSCLIGFDLGGTKMLASVYDSSYQEIGRERRKTKGHEGVERGVKRIADTIAKALDGAERDPSQLKGIGIGCPGPVSMDDGVLLEEYFFSYLIVN